MADTSNAAGAPADHADKGGPIEQVLHALGLGRKPARAEAEGERSDLVDQAEAFQTVVVGDVMIPRADIVALEINMPLKEVAAQFIDSEHSRLPVYRESLDDPVGFVHVKDVFKLMAGNVGRPSLNEPVLGRLRRETLYVPASMRAADLLLRMQASHIHLAMVIDEFGGVDGLVTLENIIEAVVGEIDDEHDVAQAAQILARAGGVFEVDGRVELDDLAHTLGRPLAPPNPEEEVDTLAGLVAAVAGRVPQRGEVVALDASLEAEVLDADPRRIKRLRLRPLQAHGGAPPSGPAAD
jgi:CBS domain containing-hemolysin-like protein